MEERPRWRRKRWRQRKNRQKYSGVRLAGRLFNRKMKIFHSAATAVGRSTSASGLRAFTRSVPRCSIRRYWRIWAALATRAEARTMSDRAGSLTEPAQQHTTKWAFAVATFFGAGRLKPGPGTWGSVAALLLWALANWAFHPSRGEMAIILVVGIALALIFGIPAATIAARESGREDPGFVVVDERSEERRV